MFERLLPSALCRKFMTPLGLELEEALDEGEWLLNEYSLRHKASKLELWIANGYPYFRLYRAADISDEAELKRMLNRFDRCVVWRKHIAALKKFYKEKEMEQTNVVLNTLRLGRIKESGGTP